MINNDLNTSKLHKGDIIKGYEAMCKILGEIVYPSKDMKSRNAQYAEWRRFINYTRDGNKFIIEGIYDKPLAKGKKEVEKKPNSRDKYGGFEMWCELCDYVRDEIILAPPKSTLQRPYILRLEGLSKGNFIANNKIKTLAQYQYQDILTTFKVAKAITKKTDFEDDDHRFNYAMKIVEKKINDVVKARLRSEKTKERVKKVDTNIHINDKANYKPTSADISKDSVLNSLW